jgi:type I restriction enzyme S subunit
MEAVKGKYKAYKEYKDSEVEWLGEVPNHWNTGRFKNAISSSINGVWGEEPKGDKYDVVCLRVADFNRSNLCIDINNITIRNISQKDLETRGLENGDLLIEKSGGGDLQPVGFVTRFSHDFQAVTSNFVARIRTKKEVDSNYLKYVYSTAYNVRLNKRSIKQTTGIQNLDQESYFNELAPYPPLVEQQKIALYLDKETSKLDNLISKKERLIELLK